MNIHSFEIWTVETVIINYFEKCENWSVNMNYFEMWVLWAIKLYLNGQYEYYNHDGV